MYQQVISIKKSHNIYMNEMNGKIWIIYSSSDVMMYVYILYVNAYYREFDIKQIIKYIDKHYKFSKVFFLFKFEDSWSKL